MSKKVLIHTSAALLVLAAFALRFGRSQPAAADPEFTLTTTREVFYDETTLAGFLRVLDRKIGVTTALEGLDDYDERGDRVVVLCVWPYRGPRNRATAVAAFIDQVLSDYPSTNNGRAEAVKALCNMIRVTPPLRLPGQSEAMGREHQSVFNDFKGTLLLSSASGSPRVFQEEWLPKRRRILKGAADQDQP